MAVEGGRIDLEGLFNTRDLGGYRTMDGRVVRAKRLIRSGALCEATPRDLQILVEEYHLGTIVDFRTETERLQKPDPKIPGVSCLFNPILDERTVGITFEEETREAVGLRQEKSDRAIEGILALAASIGNAPLLYVNKLYANLALDRHATESYGRFFDILLGADERAVLWHCSAGKDRVGVGTALLLTALGVDRETVFGDFVKTNEYGTDSAEKAAALVMARTHDKSLADCVRVLLSVSEESIRHAFNAMEAACGSVDAYLEERIGLSPFKIKQLKENYLTGSD